MLIFVSLVIVCLFQTSSTTNKTCGGRFTAGSGEIKSPNYPGDYPSNSTCEWIIEVSKGYIVQINFEDFEVDHQFGNCDLDAIYIYDGSDATRPILGKPLCGEEIPDGVNSTGRDVLISFVTDEDTIGGKFLARFQEIPGPELRNGTLTSQTPLEEKEFSDRGIFNTAISQHETAVTPQRTTEKFGILPTITRVAQTATDTKDTKITSSTDEVTISDSSKMKRPTGKTDAMPGAIIALVVVVSVLIIALLAFVAIFYKRRQHGRFLSSFNENKTSSSNVASPLSSSVSFNKKGECVTVSSDAALLPDL